MEAQSTTSKPLKLFHVSQNVNGGYDTYSDFVVCCEDEETARTTSPDDFRVWHDGSWYFKYSNGTEEKDEWHSSWCKPTDVKVVYLGEADNKIEKGLICTSFHAG